MLRRAFKAPTISVEAIQHQKDTRMFREIAAQFQNILDLARPSMDDISKSFTEIDKIVFRRTGINIDLRLNKMMIENASVIVPSITRNHPFLEDNIRPFVSEDDAIRAMKKLQKNRLEFQIDRKNARIKGDMSGFKSYIIIYAGMIINSRYTAEELTAVFMHELGHLWSWFEMAANQVTTNQALRCVAETFLRTNDRDLRLSILKEAEQVVGSIPDKERLADSNTRGEVETVILKSSLVKLRSELGSNIYDNRGCEYLADQFVIRFGGGLHKARAMEKLYNHPHSKHESFLSGTQHVLRNIVSLAKVLIASLVGILAALAGYPGWLVVILLGWLALMILDGDPLGQGETELYDRPAERFNRIKRELVDSLKNKDLDKEERSNIVSHIETIDRILENVKDRWSWYAQMWGILSPKGRRQRQKITEQQLLEQLANSDLYTLSSKLQTMA